MPSDSEAEKERVSTELKSEVADLSLEISQKVASSMTKKDQQKLDSLLTQINEYEVEGFKYDSQEELDKRNQLAENYNTLVNDVNSQISVLQAMGEGIEKDFETTEVAGIADAALIKSYKTIDKLEQVLEESFIAAPAMLGGFLLQPFDEGQAYSAAIDYNEMLKNNRANYLPDNLVMDDSSSAGQYLADMLVNNSPSILVAVGTMGSGSLVGGAGTVARAAAQKQAARLGTGIFFTMVSRKNEFSADAYSVKTAKLPDSLISGLKKLSKENLSNLTPLPETKGFGSRVAT